MSLQIKLRTNKCFVESLVFIMQSKKEFPCEAPNKHSERVKEQQPAGRESKNKNNHQIIRVYVNAPKLTPWPEQDFAKRHMTNDALDLGDFWKMQPKGQQT